MHLDPVEEFKRYWEETYGGLLSLCEWHEIPCGERTLLCVYGRAFLCEDLGPYEVDFVQVIGFLSQAQILPLDVNEEERREIEEIVRSSFNTPNISFWTGSLKP